MSEAMDEARKGYVFNMNEGIARVTHEANRLMQLANGEDPSPPWEDAPDWLKVSILDGVAAIIDGVVRKPDDSHNNWLEHKKADGWVYGPVKDPAKKTHPCMVPYHELTDGHRIKDHVFLSIVNILSGALRMSTEDATASISLMIRIDQHGSPDAVMGAMGDASGWQLVLLLAAGLATLRKSAIGTDARSGSEGAFVAAVGRAASQMAGDEASFTELNPAKGPEVER